MNERFYVGNNAASFREFSKQAPITGVFVSLGDADGTGYMAGTEGNVFEVLCYSGTQQIANDLLQKAQGYQYQGFEADSALLPHDAELGDGVTVGGIYAMLANQTLTFGGGHLSDISAPGDDEIDHAYPYISQEERAITRNIAQTRAQLRVDIDRISAEVSGKIDGEDAQTLIDQSIGEISLSVSGTSGTTKFTLKQGSTTLDTESFDLHVKSVNIEGTLTADAIRGSVFELLDDNDDTAATFYLTGASSIDDEKLDVVSGAIELETRVGDIFLSGCNYRGVVSSALQISGDRSRVSCTGDFIPNSNAFYDIGSSGFYWNNIYCYSSAIDLSDRAEKTDIDYDLFLDDFFDGLRPASFKMLHGTSGRTHHGFIAQDIEALLTRLGMSGTDFAGFVKSTQDGVDHYGLRYSEFIALCIDQIQKLKARVNALERTAAS